MTEKRSAPYGTWPSPWSAARIATAEVRASEVQLDGGCVYWLERRPAEGGRSVVVRRDRDGRLADAVSSTANARTAVYEYGGGSYTVVGGDIFYTEFAGRRPNQDHVGLDGKGAVQLGQQATIGRLGLHRPLKRPAFG